MFLREPLGLAGSAKNIFTLPGLAILWGFFSLCQLISKDIHLSENETKKNVVVGYF